MPDVHQTAVVHPKAELADGVRVGPYSVIEDNVTIGSGTIVDDHVLIGRGARIGERNRIHHCAVVSGRPQDLKYADEPTTLEMGDDNVVREFVTLHRGTEHREKTRIGSGCLFMAYSHVAHDCIIGDGVIMANSVNLAGHVIVEEHVTLGGLVPVHQFVRVGAYSFIGGGLRIPMDVAPFALVNGYPLKVVGVNRVGLSRRGFPDETLKALEKAFRFLFRGKYNTTQAVERIREDCPDLPEVRRLIDFVERSERGLLK
jgi:UDP-N-acetylglucosamine acyltransferase